MNERWQKALIGALLDKYERSSAYKDDRLPERRVMLTLSGGRKSDFPAYDIEDYRKRTDINTAVTELERLGLASCEWLRGEDHHILRCVWLNTDRIDDAYRFLDRIPIKEYLAEIIDELEHERGVAVTEWIVRYYEDTKAYLREKLRLSKTLPESPLERCALYRMLRLIDSGTFVCVTERVFSERCFTDSKYFENHLKSTLLSILRNYISGDMSDVELLRFIGISRYPEPLEMRGDIKVNGNDMKRFEKGFCLYSDELQHARIELPMTLERIITIENRANFFAYHAGEKELAVYHGGQYSPSKKELFIQIVRAMPEGCKWAHWGDIDFGGFSMLLRLRREIFADVRPYRMDREELIRYLDYTQPFGNEYAERLARLEEQELLKDCHECLEYMLEHRVRLEQEAMLIDSVT